MALPKNLYKGFHADVASTTDYYPFGFQMSDRTLGGNSRFGFNGQEKTDEVYGKGNLNTAEFWEYDTRTTRRWNIDPVEKTAVSGYSTYLGNPIIYSDPLGLDTFNFNKNSWSRQTRGGGLDQPSSILGGSTSSVTINPGGDNVFYYNTIHTNYDANGNVTGRTSKSTQFFPEDPSGWNANGKSSGINSTPWAFGNAPDRDLIALAKLAPTSMLEGYAVGSNVFSKAIAMQKSLSLYHVLDNVVKVVYAIEGAYYGIQGIASLGRVSSALRAAEGGAGNFGIGDLTYNEAMVAGRKWVGNNFRRSSRDPNIWISEDGLRQFRAPSYKPKLGIQQANFQSRAINSGNYLNNGHANIIA